MKRCAFAGRLRAATPRGTCAHQPLGASKHGIMPGARYARMCITTRPKGAIKSIKSVQAFVDGAHQAAQVGRQGVSSRHAACASQRAPRAAGSRPRALHSAPAACSMGTSLPSFFRVATPGPSLQPPTFSFPIQMLGTLERPVILAQAAGVRQGSIREEHGAAQACGVEARQPRRWHTEAVPSSQREASQRRPCRQRPR